MLNSDYTYGSYVDIGIDKITLGINNSFLTSRSTPDGLKGIIDVITYGNWSELNIQLEYNGLSHIDKYNPWYSVLLALKQGVLYGLFTNEIAYPLNNCIDGIFRGFLQPVSFITYYFPSTHRLFKLDEYELYFDFHGYNPISKISKKYLKTYENTFYSRDYKKKLRHDGEIKGARRSLLAIYDRGLKIDSQDDIKRLEFRICDDRAKVMLNPYDLFMPVSYFIEFHCQQIKQTLKRYLPPNSIYFDTDYISQNASELYKLIWFLEEKVGRY
jgi:hypothetical protein